ncbi:MAG: hypothetical protein IPG35_09145 [Flavobacteriales bacterium]|nr:hypothetical protein [Flavobacteriales bacterium]
MKRVAAISVALTSVLLSAGQNLVPNGSFEEYTSCPELISSVFLTGWTNLHTTSADYFNACNLNGVADVPLNQFGYQYASDGQAYVGLATTGGGGVPWYREIVGVELTEPLQPGVPVCLSFRTAMGGWGSFSGNSTEYSSKGLGLKFFTEFPIDWVSYLYPNSAALHVDFVPTDSAIWYMVSDVYVPDSAYSYVAVGNFFADSLSEQTLVDSSGFGTFGVAYAFVDDVRASFDLSYCTAAVGAEVLTRLRSVLVYPMPCEGSVNLAFERQIAGTLRYRFVDACGKSVLSGEQSSTGAQTEIRLEALPAGLYGLHLEDGQGSYQPVQVVHVSP